MRFASRLVPMAFVVDDTLWIFSISEDMRFSISPTLSYGSPTHTKDTWSVRTVLDALMNRL